MDYNIISADGHVDLHWLPPNLFKENCAHRFRELMPYVRHDGQWVDNQGGDYGVAQGTGATKGRPYVAGYQKRMDDHERTNLYSDGKRRPGNPELRIKDQDLDGIQGEVLYGILGTTRYVNNTEVAEEMIRIYNQWVFTFQEKYPERFRPLAVIPTTSLDAMIRQIVNSRYKHCGVQICNDDIKVPLFYPDWNKMWELCVEYNLPVHFHTTVPKMDWSMINEEYKRPIIATWLGGFQFTAHKVISEMIFGQVLDRYPQLKVVFAESGIGWLPYFLDRMDLQWEEKYSDINLSAKPSEIWRRQCYCSFQMDEIGLQHLDIIGENNVMWANDFPHSEGTWPNSREFITKSMKNVDHDIKKKILYRNAMDLYGFSEYYTYDQTFEW